MSERALYVSAPSAMSFWSEYRIYPDRLELDTKLFGNIQIPFEHLETFEVRPPLVVADLVRKDHGLKFTHRSAKLDLADLAEHVAVERDTGLFKQLRLTPDDPDAFVSALDAATREWRSSR